MCDKYVLWLRMDDKGNEIDKSGGKMILDKENAIALLGLSGYENPEKTLKTHVDPSGGLILGKKMLCKIKPVSFELEWKSMKTAISILVDQSESYYEEEKMNIARKMVFEQILSMIENIEEKQFLYEEVNKN